MGMHSGHVSVGLVGKPNVGKSTLFSALCSTAADIGDYPFTTIKPNVGVSYISVECPHTIIGEPCNPRAGMCLNGKRLIPVEIIDIPGLIRGASRGKGMGNEFLENIKESDAIILIYDASGSTDLDGNSVDVASTDPEEEISMVRGELVAWAENKIMDGWDRFSKRADLMGEPYDRTLLKKVSSAGLNLADVRKIISAHHLPDKFEKFSPDVIHKIAESFYTVVKKMVSVGNRADLLEEKDRRNLLLRMPETRLISAEYELAITKAISAGFLKTRDPPYNPVKAVTEKQKMAFRKLEAFFRSPSVTRLDSLLTDIIKKDMDMIVVYPVYDENHWTDKDGNILPDAYIVKKGTTALDLAYMVHTDLGKGFIRAIDGRTKRVIGQDHVLSDGDVIRIVSHT